MDYCVHNQIDPNLEYLMYPAQSYRTGQIVPALDRTPCVTLRGQATLRYTPGAGHPALHSGGRISRVVVVQVDVRLL